MSPNRKRNSSSLGPAGSRDFLCQEVAQATRLREGAAGVEQLMREVLRNEPASLKDLAKALGWPVPVAAAVRRELEKRDILLRQGGLKPSSTGSALFEGWADIPDAVIPCESCSGMGWTIPDRWRSELEPGIESILALRPAVDVTLDQALATGETNIRRALLLASMLPPGKRKVVFLGDDDWTSASLALALRAIYGPDHGIEIEIFDIDQRIVSALNEWAAKEEVSLEAKLQDLRDEKDLPQAHSADLVFTDPPYTESGLDLFCGWARRLLKDKTGQFLLCYPERDPNTRYRVESVWHHQGFVLIDFWRRWNAYSGNSLHAGQSALWHLQAVGPVPERSLLYQEEKSIYTFDQKEKKVRSYRCLSCGKEHEVGQGCRWQTIEALKETGCAACGEKQFRGY